MSQTYKWVFNYFHKNLHQTCRSSRPQVFLRKGVLEICSKFTGEHPCRSVISIKLLYNFTEITIRHACSPVNVLHIIRTPFTKSSAANKGRSTVNNRQSSVFDSPYSSWSFRPVGFPRNLFYYFSLAIILDNLELVILQFKHFYKTHRTSLFSFYLFIFYSLSRNHSMY